MAEYCPVTASNYVATANIGISLNIVRIAEMFFGRASRSVFPCCTISGRNPRVTYQVFERGKVVVSGASNQGEAILAIWKLVHRLSECLQMPLKVRNFRVENIVAFGGIGEYFDQIMFAKDWSLASKPPKDYIQGEDGKCPEAEFFAEEEEEEEDEKEKERKMDTKGDVQKPNEKKRKKMKGSTSCEFEVQQYRGVSFSIHYPEVIILYSSGKYVITGTNKPGRILRIANSLDWKKYKLAPGDTLEKLTARIIALKNRGKRMNIGHPAFDNARKLFSNTILKSYEFIEARKAQKKL